MAANSKIEKNFNFLLSFTPKQRIKCKINRFHAKRVKYSNFYDIFAIVCPILMKFGTAKHIHLLKPMSNQKIENFKIQVHRRRFTRKLTKISITFYSSSKITWKVHITVYLPNHWNIQTFTKFLQTKKLTKKSK